jgi:hypothetical protein
MGLRQAGRPSLRTTYALSHEANANTGLTTEAAEEDDGMREGEVLERGTVTVTFAACPRYLLQAGLARRIRRPAQLCAYAAAAGSRVRQTTGSHSMARAWHGMACCTPRVAQHLVFGSCQNTSFAAMSPSDTAQPARSRLWWNDMA